MDLNASSASCPPLCAKGCGFYGSVETMNLCSKCYKDYLKEVALQSQASTIANQLDFRAASSSCSTLEGSSATQLSSIATDLITTVNNSDSLPVKKNRCQSCNKKVGLTGFKCRCGDIFCGLHRYPNEHSCTFDFKHKDLQLLVKQNPLIKGDKLEWRI